MTIGELCSHEVVCVDGGDSITKAAQRMRNYHVGSVVVTEERDGALIPVGMLTDRDIVVAVVALGLDPDVVLAADVMSRELVAVDESAGVAQITELMRMKGVRRVPVTNGHGALVGILAANDVHALLAEEMSALAGMVSRSHQRESEVRKLVS